MTELPIALALDLARATRRISRALDVLLDYGSIDGDHHKTWAIDQAVRALTGGEPVTEEDGAPFSNTEEYDAVIAEWCDGEDGPETYEWDEGIAP